jgi:methyltransferase (TIGR00027 family)
LSTPKRSAEGNAALRYAASLDEDERLRNPDRAAGTFVRWRFKRLAESRWLRVMAMPAYERRYPGAYAYQTARTRLFDQILVEAVREGASQVVVLGAGYDTRSVRFGRQLAGDVRFFELDFPPTQERKLALISRAGDSRWRDTQFIATDFESRAWPEQLASAGHDMAARTVVLWEGVAMFVSPEAVDDTLAFVAGCAAGSAVVFDYVVSGALRNPENYRGGAAVARYMQRGGEPWKFGIAHEDVGAFVQQRGLSLVQRWTPETLASGFIAIDGRPLEHEVLGFHGVAHATVTDADEHHTS